MVTVFDETLWKDALEVAAELRSQGLRVISYPEPARLQKQFKYADKMGVRVAATIGPDEAEKGQVSLKDLKTGDQRVVSRADAGKAIRQILE
jgi:histidyl-tRNA synthetase